MARTSTSAALKKWLSKEEVVIRAAVPSIRTSSGISCGSGLLIVLSMSLRLKKTSGVVRLWPQNGCTTRPVSDLHSPSFPPVA